jgi:hypothetical protein
MSRTNLLAAGGHYSLDEFMQAVRCFAEHELRTGKRGTRMIMFSLDPEMQITSVQGCDKPPRFKRLPKTC